MRTCFGRGKNERDDGRREAAYRNEGGNMADLYSGQAEAQFKSLTSPGLYASEPVCLLLKSCILEKLGKF